MHGLSISSPHPTGSGRPDRPGARPGPAPAARGTALGIALLGLACLLSTAGLPRPAAADTQIFITNSEANLVAVYVRTATGSTPPIRTIQGPATGLNRPEGIALDLQNGEIVVANSNGSSITVYPLSASGDAAPLRTITGPATGLSFPVGLAVDSTNNEIVVANAGSNSVTSYARTASGDAAPLRGLFGIATGLDFPTGLVLDLAHDEIAVTTQEVAFDSVRVYARTASGNVAPLRTISGGSTGLNGARGIALDPVADEFLVATNLGLSVTAHPRTANGNVAPTRTLTASAGGFPAGVAVDSVNNELLVTNNFKGSSALTAYPLGASGSPPPLRVLNATAASGPSSVGFLAVFETDTTVVSTGTGPGGAPHVRLFAVDSAGVAIPIGPGFFAYDPGFVGGVQATLVGVGPDLYIVTGVGSGGGPHIKLFKVTDIVAGTVVQVGGGFMAYDLGFTGGARVTATTDTSGNLLIFTGVGSGGGPHVRVFRVTNLATGDVVAVGGGFFPYDPGFLGGVNVGAH
jgi:hypothetical protein